MPYEKELQAAQEAASVAGRLIAKAYADFVPIPDAKADLTTEVDRQSQELILTQLQQTFPTDAYCAEEGTPALEGRPQTGPRLWIIDPIDGTRGFAKKNGEFSVMIGFVEDGRLAVGVVLEPALDRVTWAVRGGGCWCRRGEGDAVRCRVSACGELAEAKLTQSHSRGPDRPNPVVRALAPKFVLETYSAGVKLALVARGEADLYVNTYQAFHDWDIAAGQILVEEAGGQVTGLHGEELRYGLSGAWQRAGLLASNGVIHAASLARLKIL
jgi:3'(2'), 5'-bisphosphate nucleotidase